MPVANHERPVVQLDISRATKRRISNLWSCLLAFGAPWQLEVREAICQIGNLLDPNKADTTTKPSGEVPRQAEVLQKRECTRCQQCAEASLQHSLTPGPAAIDDPQQGHHE